MTDPENHRTKWSNKELELLLNEVKNKKVDFQEIANKHKRTIGAIKYKLYRYSIQLAKNNKDIDINDLLTITSLDKDDLITGFEKLNFDYSYLLKEKKEEFNLISIINNKINVMTASFIVISIIQICLFSLYLKQSWPFDI